MPISVQRKVFGFDISKSFEIFLINCEMTNTWIHVFKTSLLRGLSPEDYKKINAEIPKLTSISEYDDGRVLINGNQTMKLGKLVLKFVLALHGDVKFSNRDNTDLEKFVDEYKGWFKLSNEYKFEIYKGEDILKGYDTQYQKKNYGMLGGSCMNNKENLLELYVNNTDKIQLLVLIGRDGLIHGRSLLWTLDNKKYKYMDRVYGIDNYIVDLFHKYASENKIMYREQSSTSGARNFNIYLPDGKIIKSKNFVLKTKLNTKNIDYMPYMDSMYIWNKMKSTFSNIPPVCSVCRELKSTHGSSNDRVFRLFGKKWC